MLYLLDANVLITANNTYYPVERVPEFWEWLVYNAKNGQIKMPREIMDEIKPGLKDEDSLLKWLKQKECRDALRLDEEVDGSLLNHVVCDGYAPDLTDEELEQIGRDPFLIAYAKAKMDRCVVTGETSQSSKKRQNKKIPDVCDNLSVKWRNPFAFSRELNFRTSWRNLL